MEACRLPAEWAPHERTLMVWPGPGALPVGLGERVLTQVADLANAIAAFEPVTLVARDARGASAARTAVSGDVEVVVLDVDGAWPRDDGPVVVHAPDGRRVVLAFADPYVDPETGPAPDPARRFSVLVAEHLGLEVREVPLVLGAGAIAVDGAGTVVATEQTLLHETRNADLSREEIVDVLCDELDADHVVWLGDGLVEDRATDGRVDRFALFTGPGRMLVQKVAGDDPDRVPLVENRRRLETAGIEVTGFPILPRVEVAGALRVVPHLDVVLVDGGVVVPIAGVPTDDEALARIAAAFPGREAVGVRAEALAVLGTGPRRLAHPVPAAP